MPYPLKPDCQRVTVVHVPAGHCCLLPPGWRLHWRLGPPSLLAAIFRAQASKAQGPLVSRIIILLGPKPVRRRAYCFPKDYYFFFFFFFNLPGTFGGLNVLKNSWKFAHTLESGVGRHRGWDPGVAQGLYGAP